MIVTVTTSTELTTTAVGGSLTLIVFLVLLALLIQKEIFGGIRGIQAQRLSQALSVVILPLTVVFVMSFIIKLAETLR